MTCHAVRRSIVSSFEAESSDRALTLSENFANQESLSHPRCFKSAGDPWPSKPSNKSGRCRLSLFHFLRVIEVMRLLHLINERDKASQMPLVHFV